MTRVIILILLLIANQTFAQSSDVILLKRHKKTINRYFSGTDIALTTNTGVYLNAQIVKIKNDSLFLRQFDIRQVPTQLGVFILDTVATYYYKYHYNQIKAIGKTGRRFNLSGSGASLLGGGILLTLASGVVFLVDSISMQKAWRIFKRVFLILFIFQFIYIFFCKWVNPPVTITQLVSFIKGYGLKRDYVSYDQMSPNIKLAVMASEDQLFPEHDGFDMKAIEKAIKYNEKHPNRRRGASTISQQVAKNVFLWQGGGFFRKGLEVYFTFMIEKIWSKKRILEMYLNVAETGKGIFGVQAASKAYFNKEAKNLTVSEAAKIAASLPNPKMYTVKPISKKVQNRYDDIMRQMNNLQGDADIQALIK